MSCPANTKLVIQKPSGRLFVIPLVNYQYNLLAIKNKIEEDQFIQRDHIVLSFCNERLSHDYQSIDIYHRYFHQKYDRCLYMSSIQLRFKE